jgi:hypothetical protein
MSTSFDPINLNSTQNPATALSFAEMGILKKTKNTKDKNDYYRIVQTFNNKIKKMNEEMKSISTNIKLNGEKLVFLILKFPRVDESTSTYYCVCDEMKLDGYLRKLPSQDYNFQQSNPIFRREFEREIEFF